MRFGQTWEEAQKEPTGQSQSWMKWLKKGDTTFRILQEPNEWKAYWEHFNPEGYPFPCNSQDRDNCPGCQSDNEKMKRASRKVAFNVLEGEFVNVYKVPKTVADTLDNRFQRVGTITDRDYIISRIESRNTDGSTRTTYDIEGQDKIKVNIDALELKNIEQMLGEAYDRSWGNPDAAMVTRENAKYDQAEADMRKKLLAQQAEQPKKPPFEEASYDEAVLRKMEPEELFALIEDKESLPQDVAWMSPDDIVDWMIAQQDK